MGVLNPNIWLKCIVESFEVCQESTLKGSHSFCSSCSGMNKTDVDSVEIALHARALLRSFTGYF